MYLTILKQTKKNYPNCNDLPTKSIQDTTLTLRFICRVKLEHNFIRRVSFFLKGTEKVHFHILKPWPIFQSASYKYFTMLSTEKLLKVTLANLYPFQNHVIKLSINTLVKY